MSPRLISSAARLKACSFSLVIPKIRSSSILIFFAIFAHPDVVVHLAYHPKSLNFPDGNFQHAKTFRSADDKIQITILILRRGALSSKDGIDEKERMEEERIFGITKLKLQAFSLAALEMIIGDIVVKVSSMMERTSIQIAT